MAEQQPTRLIGDWLEFSKILLDDAAIIQLLVDSQVILKTRPCPSPNCGGTLHIAHSRRDRYKRTGGYTYYCKGGRKHTHSISILYGSLFYRTNWTLQSHMQQLFHYAMFSQRVCKLISPHKSVSVIFLH